MRKMTQEGDLPQGLPYTVKLVAEMLEVRLSKALMGSLCLPAMFRLLGMHQHRRRLLMVHPTWHHWAWAKLALYSCRAFQWDPFFAVLHIWSGLRDAGVCSEARFRTDQEAKLLPLVKQYL